MDMALLMMFMSAFMQNTNTSEPALTPDDYTSYHVAVYDTLTGEFIKGVTHQGYSDDSMWARGQAWACLLYTSVLYESYFGP